MVPLLEGTRSSPTSSRCCARTGCTDVILACSYRVDDVRRALGDGERLGVRLRYVVETEPLGTGGGVRNAADLARGAVWVLNGDVLTDADLTGDAPAARVPRLPHDDLSQPVEDPAAYGLVELDADGRLRPLPREATAEEEITTNTINAGIYLIDAALLDRIPAGRVVSIEREFFPLLLDGIPCYGWGGPAYWRDIGTPAKYFQAQLDLLAAASAPTGPGRGGGRDGWIHPTATVASSARVRGPVVIGASASRGARRWGRASSSATAPGSGRGPSSTRRCCGRRSRSARRPGSRGASSGGA